MKVTECQMTTVAHSDTVLSSGLVMKEMALKSDAQTKNQHSLLANLDFHQQTRSVSTLLG